MRSDVRKHCQLCLVCASSDGPRHPLHPNLQSIPVGGRVGMDVLQLPPTYTGNRYAIVFSDYLIKWPDVFPSPDQKIARLPSCDSPLSWAASLEKRTKLPV